MVIEYISEKWFWILAFWLLVDVLLVWVWYWAVNRGYGPR